MIFIVLSGLYELDFILVLKFILTEFQIKNKILMNQKLMDLILVMDLKVMMFTVLIN